MEVIRAVYQNGMFVPKDVCVLPEGTEVELIVQTVNVELPIGSDPDEQGGVAEEFTE